MDTNNPRIKGECPMRKKQKHQQYDTDFKLNAALLASPSAIRTKTINWIAAVEWMLAPFGPNTALHSDIEMAGGYYCR